MESGIFGNLYANNGAVDQNYLAKEAKVQKAAVF